MQSDKTGTCWTLICFSAQVKEFVLSLLPHVFHVQHAGRTPVQIKDQRQWHTSTLNSVIMHSMAQVAFNKVTMLDLINVWVVLYSLCKNQSGNICSSLTALLTSWVALKLNTPHLRLCFFYQIVVFPVKDSCCTAGYGFLQRQSFYCNWQVIQFKLKW